MKSNQVEEARRNHADEEEKQKERSYVLHPKKSRVATLSYCMAPLFVASFFFFLFREILLIPRIRSRSSMACVPLVQDRRNKITQMLERTVIIGPAKLH